jgi:hypothetical protein
VSASRSSYARTLAFIHSEILPMSMRHSTLATALLLGAMLIAGSLVTAQAGGEGCTKDKKKDGGTSAAYPTTMQQL